MQIPSFLQKFGRDLIYLSIIVGMAGWIWVDGKQNWLCNDLITKDLALFDEYFSNSNYAFHLQIEKFRYDYPDKYNAPYLNRIELARKRIATFKEETKQLLLDLGAEGNQNKDFDIRKPKPNELDSLILYTRNLNDSLLLYLGGDSIASGKIKQLLPHDSIITFWKLCKQSNPIQSVALIRSLNVRAELAYFRTIDCLAKKISGDCRFGRSDYPMAISEKPAIWTGAIYEAEIYNMQYYKTSSNLVIKVDGESLPIIGGKAHFSKRYTTPGEKKYRVQIEIKNPFTESIEIISKEYSLLVVDSCQ